MCVCVCVCVPCSALTEEVHSGVDSTRLFEFSVSISAATGRFRRTTCVQFLPRYVLVNKLPASIHLKQFHPAFVRQHFNPTALQDLMREKRLENEAAAEQARSQYQPPLALNSVTPSGAELEVKLPSGAYESLQSVKSFSPTASSKASSESPSLLVPAGAVTAFHWPFSAEQTLLSFRMIAKAVWCL